jgi:hypothetical protein
MHRSLAFAIVFATLLPAGGPALAQSPERAPERDEARRDFESGMDLVRQERWSEALVEFDRSLELFPTQAALYNRALCLRYLRRYGDAIAAFERYLERYGAEVDAQTRAGAQGELDELRALVGRIYIRLEGPASAEVLVDGTRVGQAPGTILVGPGSHAVEIRAEGWSPMSTSVSVSSGGEASVAAVLSQASSPDAAPTASELAPASDLGAATAPQAPAPASGSAGRGLRIAGYALAGVAVAALGTTLGLFLWNNGRYGDWESEDEALRGQYAALQDDPVDQGQLWESVVSHNAELDAIVGVDAASWAMLGVGIAAAAASVALIVLGLRARRPVAVSVAPGDRGLMLAIGVGIP